MSLCLICGYGDLYLCPLGRRLPQDTRTHQWSMIRACTYLEGTMVRTATIFMSIISLVRLGQLLFHPGGSPELGNIYNIIK